MSAPPATVSASEDVADAAEALRLAFVEVLVAERRLRGRDSRRGPGEISMAHYRVLQWLLEPGELPAGQLAHAAEVKPGTLTQMLDALERDGIVTRTRVAEDRRRVVVALTDAGRKVVLRRRREFRRDWRRTFEALDPATLAAGTEAMQAIAGFLDAITPAP